MLHKLYSVHFTVYSALCALDLKAKGLVQNAIQKRGSGDKHQLFATVDTLFG